MRLSRNATNTDWTLEVVPFTSTPTMRPPATDGFTMTPSGTTGTITLTCSSDFFTADMVGMRIHINSGVCLITAYTDARHATATVESGLGGAGTGDALSTTIIDTVSVNYTPPAVPVAFSLDMVIKAYFGFLSVYQAGQYTVTTSTVGPILETTPQEPLPAGITITKSQATHHLTGVQPDAAWKIQAWSDINGWPACGTFHEQRLITAGSPTFPTYIWGSKSGDPLNFTTGTLDNEAIAFNMAAISTSIFHVIGLDAITVFSGDRELTARGSSDTPITPSNIQVKTRTPHGSSLTRPVQIGGDLFFVPPARLKLRGLVYQFASDKFEAADVAVIADHLAELGGGFKQIAYAREPYSLLWIITESGRLLTLTLDKEQEVTAWAAHGDDNSRYISAAVVSGPDGIDQVTFAVQRMIGGVWHTRIEQLDATLQTNCTVVATGTDLMEVTGLNHLEGCPVDIKADGFYCGRVVVSGGRVPVSFPAARIEAGLPYRTTIKDLPLELANPGQTLQETNIAINKVHVRLHESQGCLVNGEQVPFRRFPNINQPVDVFTGDKTVINLGRGTQPEQTQVLIEQDLPFPLTVLAIIKEVTING
jgi:hypothetical protein